MAKQSTIKTSSSIDLAALAAPFPEADIEWRVQRSGIKASGEGWVSVIAYINNRAVQNRLDEVCGPENWKDEYNTQPADGILCGISIRIGDEWVTKWDGADATDFEPFKGALSNSEKRAAVKWGIGRYLYRLDTAMIRVNSSGDNYIGIKRNKQDKDPTVKGYWSPPKLPGWALPVRVGDDSEPEMFSGKEKAPRGVLEDPVRGSQIIRIKTLYNEVGADPRKRDTWISRITTSAQALQAIRDLEQSKADREISGDE